MEQSQDLQKNKRPIIIAIFCIIGFIGAAINLLGFLIPASRDFTIQQYGFSYVIIITFIKLLGLIGLIGYWMMRKWGIYVYTSMFILSTVYALIIGTPFNLMGYAIPIVIIITGFFYFKQMP